MKISDNPLLRRDLAFSGPLYQRLLRLPVMCALVFVLWIVLEALTLAFSLGPGNGYSMFTPFNELVASLYLLGRSGLLFPAGLLIGYLRFSRDRRSRLFEHLYFTALDSREIVNAKLLGLIVPLGALLLCVGFTAMAGMILWLAVEGGAAGGTSFSMRGGLGFRSLEPLKLLTQLAVAAPVLLGGILGGMRIAILGKRRKYTTEILLQIGIYVLTYCCPPIGLINLQGYSRVVNEFWWHVVYLDQEVEWGGGRL